MYKVEVMIDGEWELVEWLPTKEEAYDVFAGCKDDHEKVRLCMIDSVLEETE